MSRRRGKRSTPAERIVENVQSLSFNMRQAAVLYWLDPDFGGYLYAPQPELAAELRSRATHDESFPMTWGELAVIVNTVRENAKQR